MDVRNNTITFYAYLLILLMLGASCAQVVAPTGGPKDVAPPVILEQNPESHSTNFQGKVFTLSFDEFVQLRNLKEELIVSPPLKYSVDAQIKGKQLVVEWEDTLKENTTYLFNFGSSIVDVAENNPIENYQFVFATGTNIDTAYAEGELVDAFDKTPVAGALVMLYSDYYDSIPIKEKPMYLAKTDKEGKYRITNVKKGNYKAFVLEDANRNFLFDRPDEKIAFSDSLIDLREGSAKLDFSFFQEDYEEQFVDKSIEDETKTSLIFNRIYDSVKLTGIGYDLNDYAQLLEIKPNSDSLFIWWNAGLDTTLKLELSDFKEYTDTISIKVSELETELRLKMDRKQAYYKPPMIEVNRAVGEIDSTKIILFQKDSSLIRKNLTIGYQENLIRIEANLEQDSTYHLILLPGAVKDIYGVENDSTSFSISLNNERDYGSLKIELQDSIKSAKILQLFRGKDKLIREVILESNAFTFEHLIPGDYQMKLIYDKNENGKWDTGNYLLGLQAESVVFFTENITIRSNWDKDLKWIIK